MSRILNIFTYLGFFAFTTCLGLGHGEGLENLLVRRSDREVELENKLRTDAFLENKLKDATLPPAVRIHLQGMKDALWIPFDRKTLFARGLAGKNARVLEGCVFKDWSDAVNNGLLVLATDSLSTVLTKRMENALESTVGTWVDDGFKKIIDAFSGLSNMIFYSGNSPFTLQEVESWKKLIKEVLEDIEKMLKDGLKDSLRGHDFTARPVLDAQEADLDEDKQKEEEIDFIWSVLIEGYAEQFTKMVELFEARKQHYKKTSMVVFYVDQLNKRLTKLRDMLIAAKSLKDFDTALHSSKAILNAYKRNILSLFERLADDDDIRPQTYSLASKNSMTNKNTKVNRRDDDYGYGRDSDFPNQFGGVGGSTYS